MVDDATLAAAILDAVRTRGAGKSICPSEVARALATDWRPLMPQVRAVADTLVQSGDIIAMQKGEPIMPTSAKGPIRLALAPNG